jgi:SOS-response transcriptional repressor LexA
MTTSFTARQGAVLAFIHGYTARHGCAPSYDEIASHFGTSSPSVNGMVKTLERRGLISRVPGAARSLRVLVPAALLPDGEFGFRARRTARVDCGQPAAVSPVDAAGAAAVSVLDVLMPKQAAEDATELVLEAARGVHASLEKSGLKPGEASEAFRRVAAEAARWRPGGISVQQRQWTKH